MEIKLPIIKTQNIKTGFIKKSWSSKLKNDLGWVPSVTFEQGLDTTVDWYLNNQDWLNNVTSGDYTKYYEEQYAAR